MKDADSTICYFTRNPEQRVAWNLLFYTNTGMMLLINDHETRNGIYELYKTAAAGFTNVTPAIFILAGESKAVRDPEDS